MIVEAGVIFNELHDGSIRAVYAKGRLDGGIHPMAVSIIMRHCFCTEAMERMFARDFGLYHRLPKFLRSPIWDKTWVPPFVDTLRMHPLSQMLERK